MLVVPDITSCDRWMMTMTIQYLSHILLSIASYLTCSATRFVVPITSSHFPRKSSPKNGFKGFTFFFFPVSSLLLCCCFSVLRNHFNTSNTRFSGSGSWAGATNSDGCSHQYAENSVTDCGERMKGGAVREKRSPLKVAIDYQEVSLILPN